MASKTVLRGRGIALASCALVMLLQVGCSKERRVPAGGTVTLDGKPLEGGILFFNPDVSKGNTARVSCTSPVRDGKFQLRTDAIKHADSGPGVPLGWYKAYLRVNTAGEQPIFPGPVVQIHSRYLDAEKTPLEIEVVENPAPGAYDLKVTSK
jgi:hypothetical protein